ncbi:unnamed protein product [Callosobruchus maculatus]|uniref:Uncharacterized protein n=1 Tax=Callosobruchus maculatus TaxID=64391 RepID=A0A653D3F9_CALMS|nr:unnamed protein product [Callosobruchus maculatus]
MAARHRASRQHTAEATLRERSTEAASTTTGSRREPDSIRGNLTHCGAALPWGPQCCQGSLQEETCTRKCHRTNDGCLKSQYHQTVQLTFQSGGHFVKDSKTKYTSLLYKTFLSF